MNSDVIITCAVTGNDPKVTKSPHCPITPEQIAASAVEAARAGAAIVHIHVRDPETGQFSMATRHYREVVKRIRESRVDVLVNLTCGMGGYICVGRQGLADTPAPGRDPAVHRDPVWRARGRGTPRRDGELPAGGLRVDVLRREPHADAVGGAVGAARRQRARRARGQPVPEPRGVCEQRAAGREGAHHHRGDGSAGPHPGSGPGAPQAALTWRAYASTRPRISRRRSTYTVTCGLPITR